MKQKLLIFLMVYFLGAGECMFGQDFNAKEVLKKYVKSISNTSLPEKGKTYCMEMSIQTFNSKTGSNGKTHIKYLLSSNRMAHKTSQYSYFLDGEDSFVLLPGTKTIVWNNGAMINNDVMKKDQMIQNQITIIDSAYLSSVKLADEVKGIYEINLRLNVKQQEYFDVKNVKYYYNRDDNKIDKVVFYQEVKGVKILKEFVYHQIDFNYLKEKVKPAKDYIFNPDGSLKKQYTGYRVIKNKETI